MNYSKDFLDAQEQLFVAYNNYRASTDKDEKKQILNSTLAADTLIRQSNTNSEAYHSTIYENEALNTLIHVLKRDFSQFGRSKLKQYTIAYDLEPIQSDLAFVVENIFDDDITYNSAVELYSQIKYELVGLINKENKHLAHREGVFAEFVENREVQINNKQSLEYYLFHDDDRGHERRKLYQYILQFLQLKIDESSDTKHSGTILHGLFREDADVIHLMIEALQDEAVFSERIYTNVDSGLRMMQPKELLNYINEHYDPEHKLVLQDISNTLREIEERIIEYLFIDLSYYIPSTDKKIQRTEIFTPESTRYLMPLEKQRYIIENEDSIALFNASSISEKKVIHKGFWSAKYHESGGIRESLELRFLNEDMRTQRHGTHIIPIENLKVTESNNYYIFTDLSDNSYYAALKNQRVIQKKNNSNKKLFVKSA